MLRKFFASGNASVLVSCCIACSIFLALVSIGIYFLAQPIPSNTRIANIESYNGLVKKWDEIMKHFGKFPFHLNVSYDSYFFFVKLDKRSMNEFKDYDKLAVEYTPLKYETDLLIQVENLYLNDSKIEFHIGNYTHKFERMDTEILPFIIIKPETNVSYVLSEICLLFDIFNYTKASIHHNHHGCGLFPEEEKDDSGNVIAFSHQSGYYERMHQHGQSRITVTIRELNDPVVQYYKLFKSLFFGNVEVQTMIIAIACFGISIIPLSLGILICFVYVYFDVCNKDISHFVKRVKSKEKIKKKRQRVKEDRTSLEVRPSTEMLIRHSLDFIPNMETVVVDTTGSIDVELEQEKEELRRIAEEEEARCGG
jgi:hypothetical protein